MKDKVTAIVLAAGQGRRMNSEIQKQYLLLGGKPLIYYALRAFEDSCVDEIVLVTGPGETEYCRKEIVEVFRFQKVFHIVEGGKERFHSVYNGLKTAGSCGQVLIHDGARPFITGEIIAKALEGAKNYKACVIGMPVQDTIKIADPVGFAAMTPDRNSLWMIQTPQAFCYDLIWNAYEKLFENEANQVGVTDDAMVVESMTDVKVKLISGSYKNLKVTTPEDLIMAGALLQME